MASTELSAQGSTLKSPLEPAAPRTITAIVVGNPTNNNTLGAGDVQNTRVQIDAYAREYPAVDALARVIAAAISGAFNGVRLSEQDFFEDDTKLYRVSQDFSVWSA